MVKLKYPETVQKYIYEARTRQAKDGKTDDDVITEALHRATLQMHDELEKNQFFEAKTSGTTLTAILLSGNVIYTANVGDSRSMLISVENDNSQGFFDVKQLTEDHKPTNEGEWKRIEREGGKVAQAFDSRGKATGPMRLWNKKMTLPGLSMSRSLGDCLSHKYGNSCHPDLNITVLGPKDRILILGSDGIWEFLSNTQVANIVYPFYILGTQDEAELAAKKLAEKAQ